MKRMIRVWLMLCLALLLVLNGSVLSESFSGETSVTPSPTPSITRTLKKGAKGEDVLLLQQSLEALGYDSGDPDGTFGAATRKAVQAFQRRNGLKEDGIAGPKTLAVLFSGDAIPMPEIVPIDPLEGDLPLLVNREHPVDETFLPANLVTLAEYCDPKLVKIKYSDTQAVREAVDALIRMLEDARDQGITKWQISAGYRSYDLQVTTLNATINRLMKQNSSWSRSRARKAALKTVAEPGASEHHLGLALDINVPGASSFAGTKQCTWLHEHCWDYGFIIRYQKGKEKITGFSPEAWHIRYVGVSHALSMRDNDLCLEEYLEAIESGTLEIPLKDQEETVDLDTVSDPADAA